MTICCQKRIEAPLEILPQDLAILWCPKPSSSFNNMLPSSGAQYQNSARKDIESNHESDTPSVNGASKTNPSQLYIQDSISLNETKSSAKERSIITEKFSVTDLARGIVGWEGQEDPLNPQYAAMLALSLGSNSRLLTIVQKFPRLAKMGALRLCQYDYIYEVMIYYLRSMGP